MDRDVNENLAPYWQSIIGKEQKEWYANECYQRKALGLQTIDDRALEHLRTA